MQGLRLMEGRPGSPLRRGWVRVHDLRSEEHEEKPRPTRHSDIGFSIHGRPLLGLVKLIQRWCFLGPRYNGCSPPFVLAVALAMMVNSDGQCYGCARRPEGIQFNFVFHRVFSVIVPRQVCFLDVSLIMKRQLLPKKSCFDLSGYIIML